MADDAHKGDGDDALPAPALAPQPPEWAGALRQMYDAVVDEPLPDGIAELLARLDAQSGAQSDIGGG